MENLASFEGSWEGKWNLSTENGISPNISLTSISLKPKNVFGAQTAEVLPPLSVPILSGFDQQIDYELMFLDDNIRIDKDSNETLLVFQKAL